MCLGSSPAGAPQTIPEAIHEHAHVGAGLEVRLLDHRCWVTLSACPVAALRAAGVQRAEAIAHLLRYCPGSLPLELGGVLVVADATGLLERVAAHAREANWQTDQPLLRRLRADTAAAVRLLLDRAVALALREALAKSGPCPAIAEAGAPAEAGCEPGARPGPGLDRATVEYTWLCELFYRNHLLGRAFHAVRKAVPAWRRLRRCPAAEAEEEDRDLHRLLCRLQKDYAGSAGRPTRCAERAACRFGPGCVFAAPAQPPPLAAAASPPRAALPVLTPLPALAAPVPAHVSAAAAAAATAATATAAAWLTAPRAARGPATLPAPACSPGNPPLVGCGMQLDDLADVVCGHQLFQELLVSLKTS